MKNRRPSVGFWILGLTALLVVSYVVLIPMSVIFYQRCESLDVAACRTAMDTITDIQARFRTLQQDHEVLLEDFNLESERLEKTRDQLSLQRKVLEETRDQLETVEAEKDVLETKLEIEKKKLVDEVKKLDVCEAKNEDLAKEAERSLKFKFVEFSQTLGTGGESWVCSDPDIAFWTFGYTSRDQPDPLVSIEVWHTAFSAAHPAKFHASEGAPPTAKIVGYKVYALHINGKNGWWKKVGLHTFGEGQVSFEAMNPWTATAEYEVDVFYVI